MRQHGRLNRVQSVINRRVSIAVNRHRDAPLIKPGDLTKQFFPRHRGITPIVSVALEWHVVRLGEITRIPLNTPVRDDLDSRDRHAPAGKVVEHH